MSFKLKMNNQAFALNANDNEVEAINLMFGIILLES